MFYFSFFSLFFFHFLLDNDLSINLCKSFTVKELRARGHPPVRNSLTVNHLAGVGHWQGVGHQRGDPSPRRSRLSTRRLLMLSRSRSSRTILRLRLRLSSLLCFFVLYVCMMLVC